MAETSRGVREADEAAERRATMGTTWVPAKVWTLRAARDAERAANGAAEHVTALREVRLADGATTPRAEAVKADMLEESGC